MIRDTQNLTPQKAVFATLLQFHCKFPVYFKWLRNSWLQTVLPKCWSRNLLPWPLMVSKLISTIIQPTHLFFLSFWSWWSTSLLAFSAKEPTRITYHHFIQSLHPASTPFGDRVNRLLLGHCHRHAKDCIINLLCEGQVMFSCRQILSLYCK